ncbi:MAG: hypothetical protein IKC03_05360, partial [Oscillospiraceae bacterium]|nr:hypothetical protein [Oscillospiraceae bacterium]
TKQQNTTDPLSEFYTEERFISEEFKVGIRSAIAKSIDYANLYDLQEALDIRLIVALPHSVRNKYASTVTGLLSGKHEYLMRFNSERERTFRFTIQEQNVFTVSQTIAAILGETSDDEGCINKEKFYFLSNGPTLIIDGGYYTMGLVPVSRGGSVDDSKAESNTIYSMKNVNMAVAEALSTYRPDIRHYTVEYLLAQGENEIRCIKDGRVEIIDMNKVREQKMRETCARFIDYLNQKYNSLLDFNYILVTGGTGACYYPQLLNYYKDLGLMNESHMLLTRPQLKNSTLSIEFAIAAGAYKGLRGNL